MTRHIPGLHHESRNGADTLEGVFLVRVERAFSRWHRRDLSISCDSPCLSPKNTAAIPSLAGSTAHPRHCGGLSWFLRDFGYNTDLLSRDELDEKALLGLQGIVRVSHTVLNGHSFLNFDGFAPAADWGEFAPAPTRVSHDL